MMNARQCRMARAGLRWKLSDVAEKAGVSTNTVARFEAGNEANKATIRVIQDAFEREGYRFSDERIEWSVTG